MHEDVTYQDIYSSDENLWNFLFFTGYLRSTGWRMIDNQAYVTLSIPNREVCQIYKSKVLGWFKNGIGQKDLSLLYRAILEGDTDEFRNQLTWILQDTIRFYDDAEASYHGFMEGILVNMKDRIVKSNREAGNGRYDILIRSLNIKKPVILMEFKTAKDYPSLEVRAQEALDQISDKEYDREFKMEGYQQSIRYGIAFYKKNCQITKEEIIL